MTPTSKYLLVLAVLGAIHCGGSTAQDGTTSGAGGGTPTDGGPDGDGTDGRACCRISPAPACCMDYGGSPGDFACGTVCDFIPDPNYPGWERRIDENGCPYWWTPPDAPRACGSGGDARPNRDVSDAPPDAGADIDGSSKLEGGGDTDVDVDAADVNTDTAPDADSGDPDGTAGADARIDADGFACCPISPAPACCMQYGGTPDGGSTAGCFGLCDNIPSPDYPGWEKRVDVNGCPYWWTPPGAPVSFCGGDAGGGG